jgi:hypothetical protein
MAAGQSSPLLAANSSFQQDHPKKGEVTGILGEFFKFSLGF